MNEALTGVWPWVAIVGLTAVTVITRAFFMISEREVPMPAWLQRSLQYVPLAALAAVIAPEVLMHEGAFITTLLDARLPAAVGASIYFWRRRDILGTIVVGMAIYLPLRIIWGL